MHIQPPTACNNTPSINMPNNYLLYYCGLQFILIIHGFKKQYKQNTFLRFQQICLSSYKNITILVWIFLFNFALSAEFFNSCINKQISFADINVFICDCKSKRMFPSKINNWVFATNSNFQIPISLQPNGVHLGYFKLRLYEVGSAVLTFTEDKQASQTYLLQMTYRWKDSL